MHRVLFLQKDDHRGRSGQVSICVLNRYRIFRADRSPEDSPGSLQTSHLPNSRVLVEHGPQSGDQSVSVLDVLLTVIVDRLVGRGEGVGGTSIGVANVVVQVAVERGDNRTRGLCQYRKAFISMAWRQTRQ